MITILLLPKFRYFASRLHKGEQLHVFLLVYTLNSLIGGYEQDCYHLNQKKSIALHLHHFRGGRQREEQGIKQCPLETTSLRSTTLTRRRVDGIK